MNKDDFMSEMMELISLFDFTDEQMERFDWTIRSMSIQLGWNLGRVSYK